MLYIKKDSCLIIYIINFSKCSRSHTGLNAHSVQISKVFIYLCLLHVKIAKKKTLYFENKNICSKYFTKHIHYFFVSATF